MSAQPYKSKPQQTNSRPEPTGTSTKYFMKRLKADGHTQLLAAIAAQQISVYAAACEAGYTTRPPNIGTGSTRQAQRRALTIARIKGAPASGDPAECLELWLGPGPNGSLFSTRAELQDAWKRNRDEVMRHFACEGRRPQAWWQFEADDRYPGHDHERSWLYDNGYLGKDEKLQLVRWWHREFENAFDPGFFVALAPDKLLNGVSARREHFKWADIPRSLVQKWMAEHH
jgi:hypothetical protein